MSVSRFNSEGYHDPVVYGALTNMEKEQRAAVKAVPAYRPLVYTQEIWKRTQRMPESIPDLQ